MEFKIFAGVIGQEDLFVRTDFFVDEESALDEAYGIACEVYKKNPDRTVETIMEEDEVTKDQAEEIFEEEMEDSIDYLVIPVDEDKFEYYSDDDIDDLDED